MRQWSQQSLVAGHIPQHLEMSWFASIGMTRSSSICCGGPFALPPATMVFESLLSYSRLYRDGAEQVSSRSSADSPDALDGHAGAIYTEEAFQHFLDIERTRARRSDRSFLLLLVRLRRCPTKGDRIPRAASSALLSALTVCVREVDFIGWYREGRVAAALLAQGLDGPDGEAPNRIATRVTRILSERLPRNIGERLRVRVLRVGSNENS